MPRSIRTPPENFTVVYTRRKLFRGKVVIGFRTTKHLKETWYIKKPWMGYTHISEKCAILYIKHLEDGTL